MWNLSGCMADKTKIRVATSTGQSISIKQFSNVTSAWKALIVPGSNNVWLYKETTINTLVRNLSQFTIKIRKTNVPSTTRSPSWINRTQIFSEISICPLSMDKRNYRPRSPPRGGHFDFRCRPNPATHRIPAWSSVYLWRIWYRSAYKTNPSAFSRPSRADSHEIRLPSENPAPAFYRFPLAWDASPRGPRSIQHFRHIRSFFLPIILPNRLIKFTARNLLFQKKFKRYFDKKEKKCLPILRWGRVEPLSLECRKKMDDRMFDVPLATVPLEKATSHALLPC